MRSLTLKPLARAAVCGGALLVLLAAPVHAGPVDDIKAGTRAVGHKIAHGARRVGASVSRHAHSAVSAIKREAHKVRESISRS